MFSNALNKRLLREMKELNEYDKDNMKELQLVYPFENDSLLLNSRCADTYFIDKDTPYIKIKIDKNELIIAFKKDYPFKPPTLLINNIHFNKAYKISHPVALHELKRKYNVHCLCCETLMCSGSGKWSPAMHITHVLNEYKKFKEIKRYLNSYCALLQLNDCLNNMLPPEIIRMIIDYL